jgi:anti-sigma-K factor RskA
MNEEQKDLFFDLLTKKAIYGLDEAEQRELDRLDPGTGADELLSLEMTAAAISMIDIEGEAPMPSHLLARIADDAEKWVGTGEASYSPVIAAEAARGMSSWFGWLGWGLAAAACAVLAVNIYFQRTSTQTQIATAPPVIETPRTLRPAEQREEMMRSAAGLVKAEWAPGNVKELKEIAGDVVWSDEKQKGYMRFRGLPANDKSRETYQLWIFDKVQDKATPIDGGTFDVDANGEVIIPIDAKIQAVEPAMFAVTLERPGGVVVSKREKIVALATVAKNG